MTASPRRLTVLHAKLGKYLSWSQPFLYDLIRGLDRHADGVIVCHSTENLARFPIRNLYRISERVLADAGRVSLAAAEARARWDPQVVHAHFGWSGIRIAPLAAALGSPLVVTFGGRDVHHEMHDPELAPLYRTLLARAARMICVSDDLRQRVLGRGVPPDRVVVIHRGTDLGRFRYADRGARRGGTPLRLLMVGRLVEKKGHADALAAVAALSRAGVPVHLTVVGDGELRQPLLETCRRLGIDRLVTLAGRTDEDGVAEHYRGSDLLVHPSVTAGDGDAEGLPNVVVEAAATGLPAVATRHGGIAEAVADGVTGLLVAERDVTGLADAIRALAADPVRRLAMGEAAAELARERFGLARQVARHLELYREVAEETRGAPAHGSPVIDETYLEALRRAIAPNEATILGYLRELAGSSAARDGPAFRPARRWSWGELRRLGLLVPAGVRRPLRSVLRRLAQRPAGRSGSGA